MEKVKQEKLILKIELKKEKFKEKTTSLSKVDELNKLIQEENEIVEIIKVNEYNCTHILQSGINKGNCCKNKIYLNGLCKRHIKG